MFLIDSNGSRSHTDHISMQVHVSTHTHTHTHRWVYILVVRSIRDIIGLWSWVGSSLKGPQVCIARVQYTIHCIVIHLDLLSTV